MYIFVSYLNDEMNGLPLRRAVEPLNLETFGVQPAEKAQCRYFADDV